MCGAPLPARARRPAARIRGRAAGLGVRSRSYGNPARRSPTRRAASGCRESGHRILRTPARTAHPVLQRDVGALQLLRHAGDPRPLPHRQDARGRDGVRRDHRRRHPRPVWLAGLSTRHPGRLDRGQVPRAEAGRLHRRLPHHVRPHLPGHPVARQLLLRPGAHRARHRPAQAEHQRDRRQALQQGRHAPRQRLHHLLHGHQHRCLPGAADLRLPGRAPDVPRLPRCAWASTPTRRGTSASPWPPSAWASASSSTCSAVT